MKYQDILIEKVNKERDAFRQSYANKNALDVYDDWYKINFYEAYYVLFDEDYIYDHLDKEIVEWLCQFDAPLDFLYDMWLNCDFEFNGDWDEMIDWIINLYYEEIE